LSSQSGHASNDGLFALELDQLATKGLVTERRDASDESSPIGLCTTTGEHSTSDNCALVAGHGSENVADQLSQLIGSVDIRLTRRDDSSAGLLQPLDDSQLHIQLAC